MANKILWVLLLVHIYFCLSDGLPEVKTPLGKIRGAWGASVGGNKYAIFEGIPFAKPPVGDLRFEEPQPVEPWSVALTAIVPHTCLQVNLFDMGQIQGEEDCLYLNVYVPGDEIDPESNFDVMVHIHGGAFIMGSGQVMMDSRILMDRDFIAVSINYRLGTLGFLSTEDAAIPGNNGLKDQVLALKWVKDNIRSFGGNPDSVTITGLSAGAASVHLHYFSPMSKGLFVRGMSHSGTAINNWVIQKNPLKIAQDLAEQVGCTDISSTMELKKCLKKKPAKSLLEKMDQLFVDDVPVSLPFVPVIEKDSANPFLTEDPYLMLQAGNVLDVPWITSTTTDEGLLPSGSHYEHLESVDSEWIKIAAYLLDYSFTVPESKHQEVAQKIKDFYLGPGEHINKENFYKFTKIFTDRVFATSAEVAAKLQAGANKSPVYYYLFNYEEGENKMAQLYTRDKNVKGVAHGDDMLYFYSSLKMSIRSKSDVALRNACQDMLESYITTGKPSFDGTDIWEPTTDSELVYLNVTGPENIKLQRAKNLAPVEFWRSLGFIENEHLPLKDEL